MRTFVAGATGVLGRRVVAQLAERGHDVVGLSRDEGGDRLIEERGGEAVRGDVLEPDTLRPAVEGADAVVNLATAIPADPAAGPDDWEQNHRVRREGTANLLAAAADADVDRYVNESVVWVARPDDGEAFDETAPRNPDEITASAADAERAVLEGEHPFETAVVRSGWLYAPDAVHTRQFAEQLLARRLPAVGGGLLGRRDAPISVVHADDAAAAVVETLAAGATGVLHAVDDEPVPYAAFFREFARQLDAPRPFRLPAWLLRPVLGKHGVTFATTPMLTDNERLRDETDWSPTYPTCRAGLAAVVERWREAGALRDGELEWPADDGDGAPLDAGA